MNEVITLVNGLVLHSLGRIFFSLESEEIRISHNNHRLIDSKIEIKTK